MGIECGSQVVLCDLPIHFDTYTGCSHACKYCFVKRNKDISKIEIKNTIESLKGFIAGKRTQQVNWCDWKIPLHWGGMSDPFQPIERKYKISLECLKIFAETQYPFVVSTKGKLLATDEYLSVLKKCNAVVQISMVCSQYDIIERGCPTYEERLEMVRKIAPNCKRVIIRAQPYMPEALKDLCANIPRLKEAGAYGLTIEGMKFTKKVWGLEKIGADYCYPVKVLKPHFEQIRQTCHKNGMAFYCAENRLRAMGDHMTCCGIAGLEGFKGNEYNLCHMYNGKKPKPTERMKQKGTAYGYKAIDQTAGASQRMANMSFCEAAHDVLRSGRYEKVFK